MDGVWRTRVGYAGGRCDHPTYRTIGDHTECFQVDFDPDVIGYAELLDLVWQSHDPTHEAFKTQYASVVLAEDDDQLEIARDSAETLQSQIERTVVTRIEPLKRFWLAEDYHQKYHWRQFAALWESRSGTIAPDWRSPEFGAWLGDYPVSCSADNPESGATASAERYAAISDPGYRTLDERVLEDVVAGLADPGIAAHGASVARACT